GVTSASPIPQPQSQSVLVCRSPEWPPVISPFRAYSLVHRLHWPCGRNEADQTRHRHRDRGAGYPFHLLGPWPFPPFHPINIQSLDALVAHPQLTPSSVPSRAPFHPLVAPSVHLLSTDVGRWRCRRSDCLTLLMGALDAVCTTHANGVI
ncbi:hypothetical protein CTAM01_07946, partial [Colletotrichum tamarilloi]